MEYDSYTMPLSLGNVDLNMTMSSVFKFHLTIFLRIKVLYKVSNVYDLNCFTWKTTVHLPHKLCLKYFDTLVVVLNHPYFSIDLK